MKIKKMVLGNMGNNTYIIIAEDDQSVILVDPSYEPERIIEYISGSGYILKAIFVTHGHFDHIGAIPKIQEHLPVPVITHKDEALLMKDPIKNLSTYFISKEIIAEADLFVDEGDTINYGSDLVFEVLIIPGHSPAGVCYYNPSAGIVFTGDTLFSGSIGRTDYYTGHLGDLVMNIKNKLFFLPNDTLIYPGHGEQSTIEREKLFNPYLKD